MIRKFNVGTVLHFNIVKLKIKNWFSKLIKRLKLLIQIFKIDATHDLYKISFIIKYITANSINFIKYYIY